MTPASQDEERIARFIAAVEPDAADVAITALQRSDVGWSRENWLFDASWTVGGHREEHRLILRRDPPGSVLRTDRRAEFAVLKALEATPVPSPVARWLDAEGQWFDYPFLVMDRIDGECGMFAIEGPDPLADRLRLAGDCAALLASLHTLDWDGCGLGLALGGGDGAPGAARETAHWTAVLRREQMEEDPRLWQLAGWLADHAPLPQAVTLVHGDFKPGNMLLRDGRIVALLDWETAHLGDPVEDVGWVTNPLRRREHQIPGHWETAQIVGRWEKLTGFVASPADVRYWNVLANFKLAVIVLTGMRSFAEGRSEQPFDHPTQVVDLAFQIIEGG